MNARRRPWLGGLIAVVLAAVLAASTSASTSDAGSTDAARAVTTTLVTVPMTIAAATPVDQASGAERTVDHHVAVDIAAPGAPISPLIRGISGLMSADDIRAAGISLNSWGGNPNTRYNFIAGNAWNAARDWEYRNIDYDGVPDAFDHFANENLDLGVATRLAAPALGWVAKNTDQDTCSFPTGDGGCTTPIDDCERPGPPADPNATSIATTEADVATWVQRLRDEGRTPAIIAVDNEPELWGFTHYDVHPECTTMDEVLTTYLAYARAVRPIVPDAKLAGPVACCWFDYWNTAPPAPDGSSDDYISWFLRNVHAADVEFGQRTLDYLDVHYYPQDGSYGGGNDPETDARRLRSTRSLWDQTYPEESWIDTPIAFIPRMQGAIDTHYPGTELLISEWNFGADDSLNGALAIADTLAIYGREGVDAAAYWRSPASGSPGFYAFKMHGNYDDEASGFVGAALPVSGLAPDGLLSVFGALDRDAALVRLLLINKDPHSATTVAFDLGAVAPTTPVSRFTYSNDDLDAIVADDVDLSGGLSVPAYSIVLIEVPVTTGA